MHIESGFCARIAIAVALVAIFPSVAEAAFINSVEEFDGTSVDSNTWVQYHFSGAATVANGFLDISGQNYLATRTLTFRSGSTIRARVMLTASAPNGTVINVGFTDTPTIPFQGDHVYASLGTNIPGTSSFGAWAGNNGFANGSDTPMVNNIGKWYVIQATRSGTSSFSFRLFNDAGTSLMTASQSWTGMADDASIFIGVGPTARFDWITIPEPTTTALLVASGALLLRRARANR